METKEEKYITTYMREKYRPKHREEINKYHIEKGYAKKYQARNRQEQRFRCDKCDLNCIGNYQLKNHLKSNKHLKNLTEK